MAVNKPSDRPKVPEVRALAEAYYEKPGNECGGSLHIVLDDGNVEDGCVTFCEQWAHERGDNDGVALARLLIQMTRTQREKVYRTLRRHLVMR